MVRIDRSWTEHREKANNNYYFSDEVVTLTPGGRKMLFSFNAAANS